MRTKAKTAAAVTFLGEAPRGGLQPALHPCEDVVVPLLPSDPVAVRRWLDGGRPPLTLRDRWTARPWLAVSGRGQGLCLDAGLSVAAAQLDLIMRAARRGLRIGTRPVPEPTGPRVPLGRREAAVLSRTFERPLRGIWRSVAAAGARDPGPRVSRGVVCFAAVDWWYHNRAHSDVQLARRIAANRPVLLVNSIGLRIPKPGTSTQPIRRLARKLASVLHGVRTPLPSQPNFHVFTPVALPPGRGRLRRRVSDAAAAWQVRAVCRWYGLRSPGVLVTIPSAAGILARLPAGRVVVNRSDLHSAFPEVDREVVRGLEERLLRSADSVLYVSHALMERDRDLVGDRGVYVGHGVDAQHFRRVTPSKWPPDITKLPRPRIGFFGGLDDYVVDFALLDRLCRELPDCQIVLIGDATCDMSGLMAHGNLTWLGMRDYDEIPAYGSAFDVGIMPWLDNEWIQYCNPVKLKEYLALGLPVVTTDFPELSSLRSAVRVARPEEFAQAVRAALAEPQDESTRAARRLLVATQSWEAVAKRVEGLLDRPAGIR